MCPIFIILILKGGVLKLQQGVPSLGQILEMKGGTSVPLVMSKRLEVMPDVQTLADGWEYRADIALRMLPAKPNVGPVDSAH